MKPFLYLVVTCLLGGMLGFVIAADKVKCVPGATRGCYNDSSVPLNVLDDIVDNDDSDIIETKLDETYNTQIFGVEFKLAGTLESVRNNISIYLQWMAFLALTFAVILIIYNGMMLMFSPLSPEQASKVRTRLIYIISGVILVTGFYFILKILLAVYIDIFVD